ncbi:MAG: MFS transporter [Actinobacteria bacterium]|nr:MFS transporter [Actinomycetota bacterium]MCL5883699.1 MFS transporter [Actinomycetota bacterium]
MSQPETQTVDESYYRTGKYRKRWWTLGVLSVSLLIIGLDNTILNVALPTIQKELTATSSELQWMVDAYVLVFASLLLTMGALGDRFGRKRTLQAGLIIFGISSFFAAHAATSNSLITWRSFMGAGGALIMPSTLSIITDVFPRKERGKAIGIWTGMAAVGIGLGPALGGWLIDNFSWGADFPFDITGDMSNWGSVFLINVPVIVLALLLGLFLVPESRDSKPPRIDVLGAVLSMTTLTTLVYSIIEAPSRGWLDTRVLGAFALAIVMGAAFIYWENRAEHPMLNLNFFRNPRFSVGVSSITMAFFTMFGMIFIVTQYLQFVHGYTPLQAGVRIMPFALGMLVGAANSYRLVGRLGTNRVVAMGLGVLAIVSASFYFWGPGTSFWIIGITVVAMSFGVSNTMAPSTNAVMGAVPLAKAGVGSAMNDTSRQVGGAFGVAILGAILNTIYSSQMAGNVAGLPPQASGPAQNSVGAAIEISAHIGGPHGQGLADAAKNAFMSGMHVTFLVAAAVTLVASILVYRLMPPHHLGGQDHAGGG